MCQIPPPLTFVNKRGLPINKFIKFAISIYKNLDIIKKKKRTKIYIFFIICKFLLFFYKKKAISIKIWSLLMANYS